MISLERDESDRRVIRIFITDDGVGVLAELNEPITRYHRSQFEYLGEKRLRSFKSVVFYVVNGKLIVNGKTVETHRLVEFKNDGERIESDTKSAAHRIACK